MISACRLFFFGLTPLLLLAACGPSDTRVEEGNRTGILHVGNGAEPSNLDPQTITGLPEAKIVSTLFDGLVELHPETNEPVPAAAASWEISEDGLVYRFTLQPEGRWSNGDPVTAQDFVTSYRRKLSPRLGSRYAYMLYPLEGAEAFHRGETDDFTTVGVTALADDQLELRLHTPAAFLLDLLTHSSWFPVHADTLEAFGDLDEPNTRWTRAGNLVGNGPFRLVSWRPERFVQVEKNEHHWRSGEISLQGIYFYPISDPTTEEREFRTGRLHITNTIPPDRVAVYRDRNDPEFHSQPSFSTYYYRFNTTRPPLDNPKVRRALKLAIDREAITKEVVRGGQQPAYSYVPQGDFTDYRPGPFFQYDPDEARRLLAEAGFPEGEGFPTKEILYNTMETHRLVAEAIQDMWSEELGISVNLTNQEWQVYLETQNRLQYDISRSGWIGDYLDPNTFLDLMLTDGGNNRTGWANEEYDELITQANREMNTARRNELFAEAEALLLQEAPVAPIYFDRTNYLMSVSVQDYYTTPTGYRPYWRVNLVSE
ncbi:MAG: peptide ABC transporter substrate-binding protein [Opitutales bacterium]|nr:peptide ABC transporter substrate-binding protein [Opitutales bacterium]